MRRSLILSLLVATGCAQAIHRTAVDTPVFYGWNEPRELAVDQQAKLALERLTYGMRTSDLSETLHEGLDAWLSRQLTPENWTDQHGDSALARFSVLTMGIRDLVDSSPQQDVFVRRRRDELHLAASASYVMTAADSDRFRKMTALGNRRVNEYLSAKLVRAASTDKQLAEVMTDFWENHFSVFRGKMPTQFTLLEYDRDVIRPHALGRFRDLLGAVAHSSAMLYYLDNYQNTADSGRITLTSYRAIAKAKSPAEAARLRAAAMKRRGGLNENYGRELLELHTLGVDGGYTQQDVINVARALSGWTLQAPREGGGFTFNAGGHDADGKIVLGHVLPAGRGVEDGEEVLDIVARHPATAHFIATKLVRHFVSDAPSSALVSRVAAAFMHSDGDIRQTMAELVSSPEFYARANVRAKLKSPYELVASTYRLMAGHPDSLGRAVGLASQLGQPLYGHLTPEGWPDAADAWMNTGALLARINFGFNAAAGRLPGISLKAWPPSAVLQHAPVSDVVDGLSAELFGGEMSPDTRAILVTGENPLAPREKVVAPGYPELVGLALGAPEFQRH